VSIEFHCPHCSKLIRAPAEHGGRRGKCPYCKQSVYIPSPPDDAGPIAVAPVDEAEERRRRELDAEAVRYNAMLSREQAEPPDTGAGGPEPTPETAIAPPRAELNSEDAEALIIQFVSAMRESRLEEAEEAADTLRGNADLARRHVQRLMVDELPPPSLSKVPPALYKGFLRTLLSRL